MFRLVTLFVCLLLLGCQNQSRRAHEKATQDGQQRTPNKPGEESESAKKEDGKNEKKPVDNNRDLWADDDFSDEKIYKQYLNIRAPETTHDAPRIFVYKNQTALIGLYSRKGNRDLSALKLVDNTWTPIGKNGEAITGLDGNFIGSIRLDSQGKPWVTTYYTRPSNSKFADRFLLYTLNDDQWVVVGPKEGHQAEYSGNDRLLFDDGRPVLFYKSWDRENQVDYPRLFLMKDDKWIELPIRKSKLAKASLTMYDGKLAAFHKEKSKITIREIAEIETLSEGTTLFQVSIPAKQEFRALYCQGESPALFKLRDTETDDIGLYRCDKVDGETKLSKLPKPEGELIIGVRCSPQKDVFLATENDDAAYVYRLTVDNTWEKVGTATESRGILFAPSFSITADGTPVVTWERFLTGD